MRRGSKPAKAKVEPKLPVGRKSTKNNDAKVRDLEKRLAESLEQQTATAEILRVISSSQNDVQPVFDTIIRSAVMLCDGIRGSAMRVEAGLLHLSAHFNMSVGTVERLEEAYPREPTRQFPAGRAIIDRAPAHVFTEGAVAREFPGMVSRWASEVSLPFHCFARGSRSERSVSRVLTTCPSPSGRSLSCRLSPTKP
jgi:hypothetical protein